jgi:hypothetical protein
LRELDGRLGCRFLDLGVGDLIYSQQGYVNAVESLNLEWVITPKENQPALLAEAQRLTGGPRKSG